MTVQLSDTDRVKISTEVAETFLEAYYNALNGPQRTTIATFYLPPTPGSTPSRNLPIINYNGDISNCGSQFSKKFDEMPYTFYETQSFNVQVLNPCLDPAGSKTRKEAERNMSLAVQVSGTVRLNERKEGPLRGFADDMVLLPNKTEITGAKGTGKVGEGRQWVIQTQNFRFVV